jgi:hypothetical protein
MRLDRPASRHCRCRITAPRAVTSSASRRCASLLTIVTMATLALLLLAAGADAEDVVTPRTKGAR